MPRLARMLLRDIQHPSRVSNGLRVLDGFVGFPFHPLKSSSFAVAEKWAFIPTFWGWHWLCNL